MKNLLCSFLFIFITFFVYSQHEAYTKFADAEKIGLPYTDNIDLINQTNIAISEGDWRLYGFNALEVYDPDFEYFVYGIVNINNQNVLLIKRTYREENNHWAVYLSDDGRILSHLNIAYANSEGALYIESEMESEKITVKESNYFEETPVEKVRNFVLTETGFKEK